MIKILSLCYAAIYIWVLLPDTSAQYYENLDDLFHAPVSTYFGFTKEYLPKNSITRYRIVEPANDNTDDLSQAWFDISNNNISCSINANGLIEFPSVMGPLSKYTKGLGADSCNNYGPGDYITGSQWTFRISDDNQSALLSELKNPSLDIVDNIFYKWNYQFKDLNIQVLAFAPEGEENPLAQEPRALILILHLLNTGEIQFIGKVSVPGVICEANNISASMEKAPVYGPAPLPIANSHQGNNANFHPRYAEVGPTVPGYEAVMLLDGADWNPGFPDIHFSLPPGSTTNLSLAFLVGTCVSELEYTRDFISTRTVPDWLNSTARLHKKATGNLIIPEDPMLAEMFYRYYECGHTCYLLNGNGYLTEPKGGAWSIMSILNPGYVIGLIPSGNLPLKSNVSYSLYGATIELIMAADYYQRNGDPVYFRNSAFRTSATAIVNSILATEYPETTLFPSQSIWDGPSRGDYHTGSQILVWRVLDIFSRIAGEEWNDTVTAGLWSRKADACRSAILSKCIIPGPFGQQFAEGTWKNGAVNDAAKCHDGEEVALVQSAFYGLVEQDNPLVTNHCKASMTPFNYLYNTRLNAMLWQSSSYWSGGYTFPAWLVVIAGAETNEELLSGIHLWKSMTDIDGSPWWWPYDVEQTNPANVNRRRCNFTGGFCDVAKVSYAASVFNTLLINNVMGLSADMPRKTVAFRPFSPWSDFEWTGGRIGNAFFDIKYTDDGSGITATITNRNAETYSGVIGITVPEGKILSGKGTSEKRYNRDYLQIEKPLKPNEPESFTVYYEEETSTGFILNNPVNYPNPFNDQTSIIVENDKTD
jgi:hypothetical protein